MFTEILVTALALLAGISCGWWWFGSKGDSPHETLEKEMETFTRSAERVMMAICQVHDVTRGVSHDVGNHSSEVGRISSELESLRTTSASSVAEPAISVITDMLSVNERLQAKLAAAEEKLQSQSEEITSHQSDAGKDSLTGLPNRRAFDHELTHRFAEWQAKNAAFSVMVVEVDGFKEFNDLHGQPPGEEILRHIARKLHGFALKDGVVCRFAKAEFVFIIPKTDRRAVDVALRVQTSIEAMRVAYGGKRLGTTISFGLAQTRPGENAAGLLRRAADALYAAKGAGPNSGFFHDGSECRPVADAKAPPGLAAKPTPSPIDIQLLPKLPNRVQFVKELERRLADSRKYGLPLSLVSVEVADFDRVIADGGQEAGDAFLNAIALSLKDTLREIDYLARFAQGRFAIILPGSTDAEAQQVARRMDTAIAGRKVRAGAQTVSVSLELKQASYRSGDDVNALRLLVETGLANPKDAAGVQPELVG